MTYEKPIITLQNDLAEGVYTASGDSYYTGPTTTGADGNTVGCQSQYMKGIQQTPHHHYDGDLSQYQMIDRGCEGCPADQYTFCALNLVSSSNVLKPTWEQRGFKPNDPYNWF